MLQAEKYFIEENFEIKIKYEMLTSIEILRNL